MTTGRWHWSIQLPGGPKVTADYREPITTVMQRVASAWSNGEDAELSDLEQIMKWQADNRQQIQACQEDRCDHVVI